MLKYLLVYVTYKLSAILDLRSRRVKVLLYILRPVCDLLLFNSSSSYTVTVFGLNNHLHLKEHEILRKVTYYLKYDKIGLTPFCFSHPEL